MDVKVKKSQSIELQVQDCEEDIRKGPWSVEEDTILQNYVATHGDGRWNSLARSAGTYFAKTKILFDLLHI